MLRLSSLSLGLVGLAALLSSSSSADVFVSAASPSEVIIRNGRRMGPLGRNRNRNNNNPTASASAGNPHAHQRMMTAEAKAAALARKEQTQRRRRLQAAIVTNGSFEGSTVSTDWSAVTPLSSSDGGSSASGYTVSTTVSRSGTQSIQVTDGGARQTVTLPPGSGTSGSTITFGGYSRATSTGSGLFNDYAILADVTFTDGSTLYGEAAQFHGGTTADWVLETHSFDVPDGKTVQSIDLSVLYRNDPSPGGVAYFDDLFVYADNTQGALSNPGFEGTDLRSTGWKPYMGGYTLDTATYHSGSQSLKVTSGGASQWIYPSNAVAGSQMKFSGYAMSEGASSIHGGPAVMSVYVDVKYVDGSYLLGQEAEFAGGLTDGWEYAENTIPLAKDVEAIHIRAVYYGDVQDGTAWFDDFNVQISDGVSSAI